MNLLNITYMTGILSKHWSETPRRGEGSYVFVYQYKWDMLLSDLTHFVVKKYLLMQR